MTTPENPDSPVSARDRLRIMDIDINDPAALAQIPLVAELIQLAADLDHDIFTEVGTGRYVPDQRLVKWGVVADE